MSHFDADSGKYLLDLKNRDMELVKKWLCDVYTGKSSSLLEICIGKEERANGHSNEQTDLTEAMRQFSLRDLESPDCMDSGISLDGSGELTENISRAPSKRGSKNKKKKEAVKKEVPKRKNKARYEVLLLLYSMVRLGTGCSLSIESSWKQILGDTNNFKNSNPFLSEYG